MRFVPVKSEGQQANGVVFRARDLLVRQRTQCINALRGHLSKYGHVVPQGITHADAVIAHIEDLNSFVPESARAILAVLVGTFQALEAQVQVLDAEITRREGRPGRTPAHDDPRYRRGSFIMLTNDWVRWSSATGSIRGAAKRFWSQGALAMATTSP